MECAYALISSLTNQKSATKCCVDRVTDVQHTVIKTKNWRDAALFLQAACELRERLASGTQNNVKQPYICYSLQNTPEARCRRANTARQMGQIEIISKYAAAAAVALCIVASAVGSFYWLYVRVLCPELVFMLVRFLCWYICV